MKPMYWNGSKFDTTIQATATATQGDMTTAVANTALHVEGTYVVDNYLPGITWVTTNDNPTKPKAAIYLKETGTGTFIFFGTSSSYTTGINQVACYVNPSGEFSATKVWGAVYNDYAEFRQSKEQIPFGRVAVENGDGYITICNKRMAKTPMVISDTHGFAIGKQAIEGEHSLPVAVAGRVLVYTDRDRNAFQVGDVVCTGVNGTVSKMKFWEKILYPDRIVGMVSEIPKYETWGTDNVKVDNRIWIKIV